MSELSEDIKPVVCRLCTSTKSGQLNIFGIEGVNRQLWKKIKECLTIQVQNGDALSKTVCKTCISKIEDFHKFQQACVQAQSFLEDENDKSNKKSEVTDAEAAEAARIVERLQADGSALSITPVISSGLCQPHQNQDVSNARNAFSITPVLRNSESSGDDDSQWDSPLSFRSLPCLKNPSSEDYVLMQEETFKLDSTRLASRQDFIEYIKKCDEGCPKDWDVIEAQLQRRVVLPPMWDVYERSVDKENVTHRRYVVSKSSFPCSLCGSCVSFHRQQSVLLKKQGQISQDSIQVMPDFSVAKQEHPNERYSINVQDDQNDLDQRLLRDLGVSNFMSQEVGMLDCPECGKLFPRRSSWKRHLRTHYEGRAFVCPVCEKGFNRKEHLSRHMISHTGGRPFRCETCFKPFTRKEHLARHLACNVGCGGSAAGLVSGMDQDFSVPRPYTCDVCYQTFVRKEHMLRHRKRAHLLMDGYIPPPTLQEEDDVQPYSAALNMEKTVDDSSEEMKVSPRFNLNSDIANDGPEQIEVEVNLLGDSDEESFGEGDHLPQPDINDASSSKTDQKAMENVLDADGEDAELDHEDILRMKMNEAMRQAREGPSTACDQSRCEVCQKTFTRKSHLVRHLRRFHPQVELAYAAAFSVGNVRDEGSPSDSVQAVPSPCPKSIPSRDEDNDADDDENGSIQFTLSNNSPIPATRSKGGQHPCSICGKMFGRRYHLVRHRRTQHGVESVEAGRIGRPPKRLLVLPHQQSPVNSQNFRCVACGVQFTHHSDFQSHICVSNNNTINRKIGSKAVAAMAAKISDKLLKVSPAALHGRLAQRTSTP